MEEILEKLLTSDLLSEETKTEISDAWVEAVEAKKAQLREEVELEVRAELSQQFVDAREALVEKVESFVAEQIEKEFVELRSDVERFRDLEAEFAGKLVEEKRKLAEEVNAEIESLIDKIDEFLEVRLADEFEEMKEDLEVVKQNDFGRRVFEAFVNEYSKSYVDEASIQSQLTIAESKIQDAEKRMYELERANAQLIREQKMEEVLKPLSGAKREQMQFVLQNVETEKLDEAYRHFIGRILKENTTVENKTSDETQKPAAQENKVATGDVISEGQEVTSIVSSNADLDYVKRIAGIKS